MVQAVYKKTKKKDYKKIIRFFGLTLSLIGLATVLYVFAPYLLYQLTFAETFAAQSLKIPIPQVLMVNKNVAPIGHISETDDVLMDAQNWFPTYTNTTVQIVSNPSTPLYYLTIPKLGITNARVSTIDLNLSEHMINYPGTAIPPERGTAVDFGHSTLPQLFSPDNYKTILANAYRLAVGDQLIVHVDKQQYIYDIYNITVVHPEDTSVFAQIYDDSYLTLITCTPPGTVTDRLVIKSRLRHG